MSEQKINSIEDIEKAANNVANGEDAFETTEENAVVEEAAEETKDETQSTEEVAATPEVVEETTEPVQAEAKTELTETKVEEYSPDYNYKVYDEERTFPDFLQGYVNKENEELFRDLLTRADGIEGIKTKLGTTREKLAETEVERNTLRTGMDTLEDMLIGKNYEDFFHTAQISDEDICEYALKILERKEKGEDYVNNYNQQTDLRRENAMLQAEKSRMEKETVSMEEQKHVDEFENYLETPDLKSLEAEYNVKYGEEAFREEIVKEGIYFHQQNGYDMTIPQAIEKVVNRYNSFGQATRTQKGPIAANNATAPNTVVKTVVQTQNTIPNTGGDGGIAPTTPVIDSIEKLQELANKAVKNSRGR